VAENNSRNEFQKYLKHWVIKDNRFLNGVDVGCGTARCDDLIPSIDKQGNYDYACSQWVWDCHDLDIFADGKLDFIFSSHCLEDFTDIPVVFGNWWRKIKVGGLILLLLPDMEICECQFCKGTTRYPTVEAGGNPSHRTNVGKRYITEMLRPLDCKIEQIDTIPHNESCSIDFVIRKVL
jgi:predicted SAM-dependent methyltransferase